MAGVSADEVFRRVEFHGKDAGDKDMNRFETLAMEAKRVDNEPQLGDMNPYYVAACHKLNDSKTT